MRNPIAFADALLPVVAAADAALRHTTTTTTATTHRSILLLHLGAAHRILGGLLCVRAVRVSRHILSLCDTLAAFVIIIYITHTHHFIRLPIIIIY